MPAAESGLRVEPTGCWLARQRLLHQRPLGGALAQNRRDGGEAPGSLFEASRARLLSIPTAHMPYPVASHERCIDVQRNAEASVPRMPMRPKSAPTTTPRAASFSCAMMRRSTQQGSPRRASDSSIHRLLRAGNEFLESKNTAAALRKRTAEKESSAASAS